MKVSCPSCGTNYNIDDKRIPSGGAKLKCAKCQSTFPIKREAAAGGKAVPSNPAIPMPGPARPSPLGYDMNVATSPAIPLPGGPGNSGTRPGVGGRPVVPLPGSGASAAMLSAAVPLPGGLAAPSDEEATSAAIALPGSDGATDPAPADDSGPSPWAGESTRVAIIPMPTEAVRPSARQPAIPLPSAGSKSLGKSSPLGSSSGLTTSPGMPFTPSPFRSTGAIPLPGAVTVPAARYGSSSSAVPLPGAGAVPLPAAEPAAADDLDFADADLVDAHPPPDTTSEIDFSAPPISAAVPLPAGGFDSDESTRLTSDQQDTQFSSEASGPFDFGDLPPPPDPPPSFSPSDSGPVPLPGGGRDGAMDFNVDFGEAPEPPPEPATDLGADLSAISQAPLSKSPFDFTGPDDNTSTDVPQPPTDPTGLDFGSDLPSPAGPPADATAPRDDLLDFGELPSPAGHPDLPSPAAPAASGGDFSFDFSAPPPPSSRAPEPEPPPPSPGFGEVDFGGPAPAAPSSVDPLEFDPTSKSSPTAPRDELEADLSAPIPPPATSAPADGLEMLNFIDDAARNQGSAPVASRAPQRASRWHVRRRSGKVFGPFDEGVVIKMLEDGQLLGNEDISPDGESWSPMSSAPVLSAAIQRLMDSPSRAQGQSGSGASAGTVRAGPQSASMDRLKSLYEGRMAAVAVVDRRQDDARFRRRLPFLVVLGVAGVVALGGASLAFTRYGMFGMKLIFPAKLPPSSPQYAQLQDAKKALLQDTFKSYREARDLTGKILASTEYPEVRAVWCQAVFYLQRRYAAATAQEKAQAAEALERVALLGMKNAEVVKAFAGHALAAHAPAEALPLLLEAKARAANESDRELDMLLAETYASKGDPKAAEEALQRVLKSEKGSAKALHALGNLKQAAHQADDAAKSYEAALEADPNHAMSAVELAAVDLLVRHNDAEGLRAVEKALSPQSESLLGPAELSRAKALRGVALAAQFKSKEATDELEQALKLDPDSVFAKAMLARVLLAQHEVKRALPLFKEATTREPADLEYAEGYLQALIANGNMSEATIEVARVNQRFPGNARIAFLYGRISDSLDNATDAETHYKRAIAADPKLYQANLALARFYLRMRRVADAKPQMEAAQQQEGAANDASVHVGLGDLAFTEGSLQDARREFEAAMTLDPTQPDAHLGISKVDLAENGYENALKEAEQALKLDEHVKEGRLSRALALWKLGRMDDAIEELAKAKQEDPKSARVMITTGAVQLDRSNLPAAETALLSALTMEPSNHEAHFYMARVKAKRYEYTQAIESMKNALERAPKRAAYHYELGLIYRDAKRLNDAIESWNTAVKLDAKHADALEALGQAYLDRGELDHAVESFDASLKADPARTRILSLVGDCYFQAAKWPEAISRYNEALKIDPKLVQVYYKLGRAYSEKGEHAKSVALYQKATQLDKDNAMPYYYLAYAYKERGRKREAVIAFRDYLKRKPDAEDKKEIEDEIYDLEQDYQ
jgi:predicted Zn finger-like uncharacterized protein